MSQAPAGWHPDGQGNLRYWDGTAWTEHIQPATQGDPYPAQNSSPAVQSVDPHQSAQLVQTAQSPQPAAVVPTVQHAPSPQAAWQQPAVHPYANLQTNRSLLKLILLSFITFGIYAVWQFASSGENLNMIASRYDGKRSMNYWLLALVISPLTAGIAGFVWWHKASDRIGNELLRRGLPRTVSASDFWLWGVLGSLIIVGPFIFMYKWLHAMNELSMDFNARG